MTDTPTSKGKKKVSKKGQTKIYVAAIAGAGIIYYLYKKHQANTASSGSSGGSSSGSVDPLTGNPYSPGVGSLASSAMPTTSGVPASSADPNAIDPATGNTFSSELSYLQGQLGTGQTSSGTSSSDPSLSGLLGPNGQGITPDPSSAFVNPGGPNQSVTPTPSSSGVQTSPRSGSIPTASRTLSQWSGAAHAQLVRAGISPEVASQTISQYLSGKAITNANAAHGLSNITSAGNALGAAPVTHGAPPTIRVAKAKAVPHRASRPPIRVPVQTRYPRR